MHVKYLIVTKMHGGRRKVHVWKDSIIAGTRQRLV